MHCRAIECLVAIVVLVRAYEFSVYLWYGWKWLHVYVRER